MKPRKIYRVVVRLDRGSAGGWCWVATDAAGKTELGISRAGYQSKYNAKRGARRACGPKVRIVEQ